MMEYIINITAIMIFTIFMIIPFLILGYKFYLIVVNKYINLNSYKVKNDPEMKENIKSHIPILEKDGFKWLGVFVASSILGTLIMILFFVILETMKII